MRFHCAYPAPEQYKNKRNYNGFNSINQHGDKSSNKGKPKESWMKNWTQEQRTEKFFEFCRAYDQREDSLLKNNYQQFSHRLHWDECPFVYLISKINDPKLILNACLYISFIF
jgi:hypothetical protein